MQRIQMYTLFVLTSMIWAGLVMLTGIYDSTASVRTSASSSMDPCGAMQLLNNTVDSLKRENKYLQHRLDQYREADALTSPSAQTLPTATPSVIEKHFGNFSAKEKLHKRLRSIVRSYTRPEDRAYNFNVTKSDRTPYDRGITDTRPSECKAFKYDVTQLRVTSVIVPFYNEALSMLVRTVFSILSRTPDALLKEIILVDDASTYEYVMTSLRDFVRVAPKVKLIRNVKREGLVRSRLIGAEASSGDVLVFLDAHTEANTGQCVYECNYSSFCVQFLLQFKLLYVNDQSQAEIGVFSSI